MTTGGVDTIEASLYVHWPQSVWEPLVELLESRQEQAREAREARVKDAHAVLETGEGDLLRVQPTGAGRGRYRWVLTLNGITLKITGRREFGESQPNAAVEVGSLPLMLMGHRAAWDSAMGYVSALGGEVVGNVCSRIDIAADLVEVDVVQFWRRFLDRAVIRRSRKFAVQGAGEAADGCGTLYLGDGKTIVCRIYDKLREVMADDVKWPVMVERRWGYEPKRATRVEFQLRREKIQEHFGAKSVEECFAVLPQMAEWLTSDWLRFCEESVDKANKNHQRAKDAAIWEVTREAFQAWAQEPDREWVKPVKRAKATAKQLVTQAVGCLAAAMARTKAEGGAFALTAYQILQEFEKRGIEVTKRKRLELEWQNLVTCGPGDEIPF